MISARPAKRPRITADEEVPTWHDDIGQSQRRCGAELFKRLQELFALKKLSAAEFCELNYWCNGANVPGADFAKYSRAPGDPQTGAYQQFLDRHMHVKMASHDLHVPCTPSFGAGRVSIVKRVSLAHESLADEIRNDNTIMPSVQNTQWPPKYYNNPCVVHALETGKAMPLPVAVYSDGVRYTSVVAGRSRSVCGFWLINLVTGKRHWIGELCSHEMCRCGCKGWCSNFAVLSYIAWMLKQLKSGRRSMQTSDGSTAKRNSDIAKMFRRYGPDLGFEAVLLWMKGDHSDSSKTHALPAVTGRHSPCQFCKCTSWTMNCFTEHWSVLNCPFDITDDEAYFQFCDSRETKVEIRTEADRKRVVEVMVYKRGKLGRGRTVATDVPALGLKANDSLEPSPELQDVGQLETSPLPMTLTFWTPLHTADGKPMGLARHRNPLYSKELGTNPSRTQMIDILHTFYYGPMMRWLHSALWRVLLSNPWGIDGNTENKLDIGIKRMKMHMNDWFVVNKVKHCDRINDLTLSMLGTQDGDNSEETPAVGGTMHLKAAETGVATRWACQLIKDIGNDIAHRDSMLIAGEALVGIMDIVRTEPMIVAPHKCQQLFDLMHMHLFHAEACQIKQVPKCHFCLHLFGRQGWET